MTANPLSAERCVELAKVLDAGLCAARELARLTEVEPALSVRDAYRIQDAGIELRLKRGERIIGYKMGLTSRAKREQMNLHEPIYGVLTDRMQVTGAQFSLHHKIHPKIEPEIAFLIRDELKGKVSRDQVVAACGGVAAAMEILDSRYIGFKYFSLPDVVADNASSAFFVLGDEWIPLHSDLELSQLTMVMSVNDQPVERALSQEISGDPLLSVVQLCELLTAHGKSLPKGSIVLAGAATNAVQMVAGQRVRLSVDGLPPVSVEVNSK